MGSSADGRMRLTVLGGYLGSGKTTWLRHRLHAGALGQALIIVNEAAEAPVDDLLLTAAGHLAVLAGGCACCTARAKLLRLLREVCDVRSAVDSSAERIDDIVLETSGLADPAALAEAIRTDPVLVHHILVGEIIVTVDAIHALDQLRADPLERTQIEMADRLVVTKVDLAEALPLRRLLATLRRLNPGAALLGASRGLTVELPPCGKEGAEPLPEPADTVAPSPLLAATLHLDRSIDWTALSVWLSALLYARGEDVLRIKGVVRTPAGRLLLQTVRGTVQAPEILPPEQARLDDVLVVIGRGYRGEQLARSLRYFAAAGKATPSHCVSRTP